MKSHKDSLKKKKKVLSLYDKQFLLNDETSATRITKYVIIEAKTHV